MYGQIHAIDRAWQVCFWIILGLLFRHFNSSAENRECENIERYQNHSNTRRTRVPPDKGLFAVVNTLGCIRCLL